jgi:hypothetical protein
VGDFVSGDDVRSCIAICISLISLAFSWRSWLQSNRPVVTAFVCDQGSGNVSTTLNLVVSNSGNRPATCVRLKALESDISTLFNSTATPERRKMINDCFQEDATIPVLRNGEEISTCFGVIARQDSEESWMLRGAAIEIKIEYGDLGRRRFVSKMPLKIHMRNGFAGAVWKSN